MSTSALAVAPTTTRSSLEQIADKAREFAAESMAANTRRTYRTAWNNFSTWCAAHGLEPLPAAPPISSR